MSSAAAPATDPDGAELASAFMSRLPISGVAICVTVRVHKTDLVHASDSTAARLEEIHFDLGVGPVFDAVRTSLPILIPDVSAATEWPVFLSHAADLQAGAAFAFPLAMGAASIGAVLCYRSTPGALTAEQVETGSSMARTIAAAALRRAIALTDEDPVGEPVELRREAHQATGMVLFQLETTASDAFAIMRAYAFSNGISLREVAQRVITRRLDFSELRD